MQIVGRIYISCLRAEVSFPPDWLWGEESFSAFRGLSQSFCYGPLHIRHSNGGLSSSQALKLSCLFCWSLIFSLPLYLWLHLNLPVSVQFGCSVVPYSLWRMDCSTPGLLVHHQLPELTQTHVHRVSDAIQPSHPLLSPSPTFNFPSFGDFSDESALCIRWPVEFQLQHQSFQWIFRTDFL